MVTGCGRLSLAALIAITGMAQTAPPAPAQPDFNFGRRLVRNTGALFSRQNVQPLLWGSAISGSATLLDDELKGFFSQERRWAALGNVGAVAGSTPVIAGVSGALFLVGVNKQDGRLKSMSFDLAQGLTINNGFYWAIKGLTQRERPDGSNLAFPSGHAADSMMAATVVSRYYPKLRIPMYLFAALVAASRLEKNKHWLSDVTAGAALGYIVGTTVVRGTGYLHVGRVQFAPVVPRGGGIALSATIY